MQRGRDIDVLQRLKVSEVMTHDVDTVLTDLTLTELSDMFVRTRHHGLLVLDMAASWLDTGTAACYDEANLRWAISSVG